LFIETTLYILAGESELHSLDKGEKSVMEVSDPGVMEVSDPGVMEVS